MSKEDIEIIRTSEDGEWTMAKEDEYFFFYENTGKRQKAVRTPGGNRLKTMYPELADRILSDLSEYGPEDMSAGSVLPWQYTIVDNFGKMNHETVVMILEGCFLNNYDWTTEDGIEDVRWNALFGEKQSRNREIERWLKKCSHMQLTAACCIGNAYHSLNVSYVLAKLMEEYDGQELKDKFSELMDLMIENSSYFPGLNDFETFNLFYGIHLKENGKIICVKDEEPELPKEFLLSLKEKSEEIILQNNMAIPDIHEFFNTKKLCMDIMDFCKKCYFGQEKMISEFFISAYYDALCLTIHHIMDEKSFNKHNAYQFLLSQCDTEFCDIYSDKLFGYTTMDKDSDNIWNIFNPFIDYAFDLLRPWEKLTDDHMYAVMEACFSIGIAVANKYYKK